MLSTISLSERTIFMSGGNLEVKPGSWTQLKGTKIPLNWGQNRKVIFKIKHHIRITERRGHKILPPPTSASKCRGFTRRVSIIVKMSYLITTFFTVPSFSTTIFKPFCSLFSFLPLGVKMRTFCCVVIKASTIPDV